MAKQAYLTGCNNYTTHAEAMRAWGWSTTWTALTVRADGSACIDYLQSEPMQAGQVAYVGSLQTIFQNWPKLA